MVSLAAPNKASGITINWDVLGVISNAVLVTVLIIVTVYYAIQTHKQAVVMHKNMENDRIIRKYDQLREEMNKLIGPLYGKRHLIKNAYPASTAKWYTEYWIFWPEIKQNIYLSRSDDLTSALMNYFDKVAVFSEDKLDKDQTAVEKSKKRLIEQIETRYDELSKEIDD